MSRTSIVRSAVVLAALAPAVLAAPTKKPVATRPAVTGDPTPALTRAKTIQVTETLSAIPPGSSQIAPIFIRAVQIERPNRVHMEQREPGEKAARVLLLVSDGSQLFQYMDSSQQYRKDPLPSHLVDGMLGLPPVAQARPTAATLDGRAMLVYATQPAVGASESLYVDAQTRLPRRLTISLTAQGKTREAQRIDFSGWVLNKPLQASLFAFVPPAGAKEYVAPKVLANGVAAPDFTVQDRNGTPVKLSDYKGKVVVLDFWATWCGPCMASLPHTNQVAKDFKDKGVVVLAVNVWDTKDKFDQWLPTHAQFDAIIFAIDTTKDQDQGIAKTLYGVAGIPTQFVIGKDGKVVKSFVGFGGPNNDLADAIKAALGGT